MTPRIRDIKDRIKDGTYQDKAPEALDAVVDGVLAGVKVAELSGRAADWLHAHQLDIDKLPVHMREAITAYVLRGRSTGSFLNAVLSNDLVLSFAQADNDNLAAMFNWASFLYYAAPGGSYGSADIVRAWRAKGGLQGKADATT